MAYGFLKSENSLQETHKVDDLFDFSGQLEKLKARLGTVDHSVVIGLFGDYGTGKSTLLYQLEKEYEAKNFIHIDLWRYPERTNLWKNFLYALTLHYGGERAIKKLRKITEGKQAQTSSNASTGISMLGLQAGVEAGITDVHLEQDSIDEIQQEVLKQIKSKSTNLIIVIEDVDRSREHGAYFLETLKMFIQDHQEELGGKSIKIIIPMHPDEFNNGDFKDSYQKSIDITWNFSGIPNNYMAFINECFDEDLTKEPNKINRLSELIIHFSHKGNISIRTIKRIIKEANERYRRLITVEPDADWSISIMAELMRNYKGQRDATTEYSYSKANLRIQKDTIFNAFLESTRMGRVSIMNNGKLNTADQAYSIINYVNIKEGGNPHLPFISGMKYHPKDRTSEKISDIYFKDY